MIRVDVTAHVETDVIVSALGDDVNDAAEFLVEFADIWTEQGWENLAAACQRSFRAETFKARANLRRLGELLIEASK